MKEFAIPLDVVEQIRADFPASDAEECLRKLIHTTEIARIQRCIVVASQGSSQRFDDLCKLAANDYRDVIVAAEYDRNEQRLFDFNRPIQDARIVD